MAAPKRNAPCPCGSGKKYKLCCLARDEAIRASPYERILRSGARNPEGLHAIGLTALHAGDSRAAITLLRRAIEGNPAEPTYYCNLGLAYKAAGRTAEAIESYRLALVLDPEFAPARGNLGVLYFEDGRLVDAVAEFEQALSAASDSPAAFSNLGTALMSLGESERALDCFRQALARDPRFVLAYNGMGNLMTSLGKPAEAVASFENALLYGPGDPKLHFNLARALSDFGKVEEAAVCYRESVELDPGFAEGHNGLGVMLLELGRKDEAAGCLRTAIRLDPGLAEAHFNLHSALLNPEDLLPSIACLVKAIKLRPADALARVQLAILYERSGNAEAAAACAGNCAHTAESRALADGWAYLKASGAANACPTGTPHDGFRIGIHAARPDGLVLEFGVRFGNSIRQIATLAKQTVHGFDSFEGLPESWHDEPRGSYSTLGGTPAVPSEVQLHRGWFDATLPGFLSAHAGPVRFMHIDCDIYSSTRTVLDLLAPRVGAGTVIVFDEYFGHEHWREDEHRALLEAATANAWRYDYLCFGMKQAVIRIR
ncbi:MAG: tetratricopeptide repeat protein [Betaproteobacteria bacterium]